jgi:hypothetical protein
LLEYFYYYSDSKLKFHYRFLFLPLQIGKINQLLLFVIVFDDQL